MNQLEDLSLVERMTITDLELRHLLAKEISSFSRWDVLRFFLETGQDQATMDEIGDATGRDSEVLLNVMGALTTFGWLARRMGEGETSYLLTQEEERRRLLDRLHASFHDSLFRQQAIYQWTRGA